MHYASSSNCNELTGQILYLVARYHLIATAKAKICAV
jgi:hypothetical protein